MKKAIKLFKTHGRMLCAIALGIITGFTMAACDGGGGGGDDPTRLPSQRVFSVSGTFTKSDTGEDGEVKFALQSDAAAGRAVAADSYTVSGKLEDGDITMNLSGTYNPKSGAWTVSARSSIIIYTIDGAVNTRGASQGSTATIAVKSGSEWIPYVFPVVESEISIPGVAIPDEVGGTPGFARGWWHSSGSSHGVSWEQDVLISQWKIVMTGTQSYKGVVSKIKESGTIIDVSGSGSGPYTVTFISPDFEMTPEYYMDAVADFLGISQSDITALKMDHEEYESFMASLFSGSGPSIYDRFIIFKGDSAECFGNFTPAEFDKLDFFWALDYYDQWAAKNKIPMIREYSSAKVTYRNGNNAFDLVGLGQVGPNEWDFKDDFGSLAELNAATLVEEYEWDWASYPPAPTRLGVHVNTFTRR